ncbi:MAG: prepilin-type N-terminal cleavage/methylation domain-containing protein [Armatimonadetes bacterium]|nr:prepilin-type N-terminal cleavage/methylation domain-containing protein [Armatimonadota bacterium]
MNSASRNRGFSIVEVVIAMTLIIVGVTALMRGMGGIDKAEAALVEKDIVVRLAHQKLDELIANEAYKTETQGNFDAPYDKYSWTLENTTSGVDNLSGLRLTVTDTSSADARKGVAETLKYTPPTSTEATQ